MAKAGRWIRSFWTGKKDKDKHATATAGDHTPPQGAADHPTPTRSTTAALTTPAPPREKKRWSFRRSVGNSKELGPPVHADVTTTAHPNKQAGADAGRDTDQNRHAAAVAAATAAATDAAIAAAQAAAVVIHLTSAAPAQGRPPATAREEAAAVKIQAAFRSYLAQKALRALKGLVKLQALIRGHLVRKQATATLRCMETLVSVQARARAHRIRMAEEAQLTSHRTSYHRGSPSPLDPRVRRAYEMDRNAEEDIKIVEMDVGDRRGGISRSRNSYSASASQGNERADPRLSSYIPRASTPRVDHHHHHHHHQRYSPAPSTLMDNMSSPRGCSGHFDEFSFRTAQTSPHYYYSAISKLDYGRDHYATSSQQDDTYSISSYYNPFCPSYMANTESSRAKVRSQSAPRQRPDTCERTPSRRKQSLEGRNIPRAVKMQRSSSQAGSPSINGRQIPWALKQLDRSCISVKDSECGSTSSMMTNPNYCRSLVPYDGTRS